MSRCKVVNDSVINIKMKCQVKNVLLTLFPVYVIILMSPNHILLSHLLNSSQNMKC